MIGYESRPKTRRVKTLRPQLQRQLRNDNTATSMVKRRRELDSDDAAVAMAELNTLFIDTSLDTHLVMLVSSSDTVADFKKKLALEHKHCFPEIGEIQVHTVKVKRRSNFYHLPDIMLVWSAFHGVKKNWFLSVDASSIHTQLIRGSLELGTNSGVKIGITNTDEELGTNSVAKFGITNTDEDCRGFPAGTTNIDEDCRGFASDANKYEILWPLPDGGAEKNDVLEMSVSTSSGVKIGIMNTDEDCRGLASDANKNEILPLPLADGAAEKNDVSQMIVVPVFEAEKPAEKLMDSHGNIYSEEHSMETKSRPKKKRKVRHTKDESHNCGLDGGGVMFRPDGKDENTTTSDSIVKVMNDQFDVEDKLVSEKASPPTTAEMAHLGSIVDSQNLKDYNRKKEDNGSKSMMDFELCQDVRADHSRGVSIMVPDFSARLTNASEDAKTSGSKRKKKKVRKTTAEIQDVTYMAQIGNDERIKPTSETHKFDNMEEGDERIKPTSETHKFDNMEERKELSLEQDREGIMPSNGHLQDAEKRNFRIVNSPKLLDSDEMKEVNVLESKMNNELDQDFPTMHSGGGITNMPDLSTRVMDVSGGFGDANASGKKRRKKKVQKITVEVQDTRDVEQIGKDEVKNTCTETKSEEKEEEKDLSLEHDNEVILTPNRTAPDHVDPDLAPKETSFMRDADAVMNNGLDQDLPTMHSRGVITNMPDLSTRVIDVSGGVGDVNASGKKRRKKKVQKITVEVQDSRDLEQIGKGEMKNTCIETKSEEKEEEKGLSLEQDNEVILTPNRTATDHVDPDLAPKETIIMRDSDADAVMNNGLDQDFPKLRSGAVITNMPDLSTRVMGVSGGVNDVNASGKKRRKKKVQKITVEVQDTRDVEQIGKGEMNPCAETKSEEKEEEKGCSLEHDNEVILTPNSKAPDHVDPDSAPKESSFMRDADADADAVMNNGLDQDFPKMHSGGVITNMPDLSTRVMDVSGGVGDVNASGKKRRKKKVQKITEEVQDTRDVELIGKGEMKNPCTETKSEEKEEEKGLSLGHDNEVILTPNRTAPDHVDPDLAPKETSFMRDADTDAVMNPEISSGSKKEKKKKSGKKSVGTSTEKSGINNGTRGSSGLSSPSTNHIPKKTGKEESIRHNEGNDDQMKLLDISNHYALEKAQDTNKKEVDFVTKTQTEQTLKDVSVGNQKMAEKALVSAGNCHNDFLTGETENAILETNQDDKNNENTENKSRKTTKKRKREKHTATDVHEKLPFKGTWVGIEPLATTETSIGFVNSEQEGRHVGSSEVLPHKSEETAGKMHEIIVKSDELAENSGKGIEEINFKQYFLLGEHQYKVNSKDKNKKNPSLDKSSSGRSETLPSNVKTQRSLWGLNGTNMMQLKTPKKKSLLDKSGAIFQDNSGESSGDENGTMHSDDSTASPSDSSSMSGVSQNSTSRGSNDAEVNSQRNMSKLDVSTTSLAFILRNSKRFEKAKQLASQSESQPIEFVPDTQLT